MKLAFISYLAFVGVLAFLVLFVADREMKTGMERLSNYRIPPRSALDINLKVVSSQAHDCAERGLERSG